MIPLTTLAYLGTIFILLFVREVMHHIDKRFHRNLTKALKLIKTQLVIVVSCWILLMFESTMPNLLTAWLIMAVVYLYGDEK